MEFTATAEPAPLTPDADVELSGKVQAADVRIPEGVTVRTAGDLSIEARDSVVIEGVLESECQPLRIGSGANMRVTGTVRNRCGDAEGSRAPPLELAGQGEIRIEEAALTTSGGLVVKNDTSLAAPEPAATAAGRSGPGTTPSASRQDPPTQPSVDDEEVNQCLVVESRLEVEPRAAPPGAPGSEATDGLDGGDMELLCDGVLFLLRTNLISVESSRGAVAVGGAYPFAARFLWRCLNIPTIARFPRPAPRTGRADFPHPALHSGSRRGS